MEDSNIRNMDNSDFNDINYGPLSGLIGTWKGNKGVDLAPEPDGTERNEFYETIIFSEAGDLSNAEEQNLSALHYISKVQRVTNDRVIHQETGYWMWEHGTDSVIHSLTIPRGICVLAGGTVTEKVNSKTKEQSFLVEAKLGNEQWPIIQTAFLRQKASMKAYQQQVVLSGDTLQYKQNMQLDIYGRVFDHNDENTLTRVK